MLMHKQNEQNFEVVTFFISMLGGLKEHLL